DNLTNLFNQRYLEETLERELRRAARKQVPLGIIMLDIDYFKNVNDTQGHAAGDALLKELGKLLKEQTRYADIACRYGGDEFVLILPEASLDATRGRAEDLRDKVGRLHVEYRDKILEPITISLGVAVFPDHGATGKEVLESADIALYRAKREGRNCVVMTSQN
ncbi:GGDEF domain-containing protein, partial [bacterium]|nr:GGDEF domain-containing protein [bacterium]